MVPKGWQQKRLGNVAELQRGFDLPSAQRLEGSVPIISSGGRSGYHSESKVGAPGIVTGRYGSIGDVFFLEEDFWPLNTSLWVKNFHGNDPKYLYYLLSKIDYKKFSDKTGVPGVNRNDLHAIKVVVPPLPEQKKISQILSTWDKAITTTEKLLANSQQQKKALMQKLLTGKKRFPGFDGEWKKVKISDLCEVRRGASPRPIKDPKWFSKTGRGWIRIADVSASKSGTLYKTVQYLSEEGVKNSVSVDPGDLIMSICATIGVPKFIGIPSCIHDGFVVFRNCSDGLSLNFLYHYLIYIREELKLGGQPGTQKNLNTGIVGDTLIPHIQFAEQIKITKVLSAADNEILRLAEVLDSLKLDKRSLMQQLLKGKRRVVS